VIENSQPSIIITTGEPAGIGPELAIQLANEPWPANLVFAGDPNLLSEIASNCHLAISFQSIDKFSSIPAHEPGKMVLHPIPLKQKSFPGQLNSKNSAYVLQQLAFANEQCMNGNFQAVVTAPVHKGIINDAGFSFSGHTEYFANNSQTEKVVMLLAGEDLRVALATTHLPLAEVSNAITQQSLTQILNIIFQELTKKFALDSPRVTVLGLNPHAGENGYLGKEEIDVISPVIKNFRKKGYRINGPVPADTAFGTEQKIVDTDLVLAMYHDQGLPVLKFHHFSKAANITLGLPYIRTSVDHGTALDIAGKNIADANSFRFALNQAISLSHQKYVSSADKKGLM